MIRVSHVSHAFGPTRALEDVSLEIPRGRTLGLLGENGAGKTTLMKILYGLVRPQRGTLAIDREPFAPRGPRDALARGIGMVQQHFALVPALSVAQNVVLGLRRPRLLRPRRIERQVARFAEEAGLELDAGARVGELSVGQRQRVEILKVLFRGVSVLILDEPTAVLTPDETAGLFATLRRLRERGMTVVFISHKLREIVELCDDVAVLRRGRLVHGGPAREATPEALAERMVGARPAALVRPERAGPPGSRPVLELAGVSASGAGCDDEAAFGRQDRIEQVDLIVRSGEIVGVAGVDGNGQDALAGVVAGLLAVRQGTVRLFGQDRTRETAARRAARGVAHIPGDRQREGLFLTLSVMENVCAKRHRERGLSRWGWLRGARMRALAREVVGRFDVRASSLSDAVAALSGGNQQKLLVGRELIGEPGLVVAVNPTRGLDVAAAAAVRRELLGVARRGAGVLLVSTDLDELIELSDRILVLYSGRLRDSGWPRAGVPAIARLMAGLTGAASGA